MQVWKYGNQWRKPKWHLSSKSPDLHNLYKIILSLFYGLESIFDLWVLLTRTDLPFDMWKTSKWNTLCETQIFNFIHQRVPFIKTHELCFITYEPYAMIRGEGWTEAFVSKIQNPRVISRTAQVIITFRTIWDMFALSWSD